MNCPYCTDAYTNKCLSLGITNDEMMEAIHAGALLNDSIILSGNVMIKLKSFYGPIAQSLPSPSSFILYGLLIISLLLISRFLQ